MSASHYMQTGYQFHTPEVTAIAYFAQVTILKDVMHVKFNKIKKLNSAANVKTATFTPPSPPIRHSVSQQNKRIRDSFW